MEEEVRGTVDQNEEVRTAAEPVDVPTAEELAESVDVPIEENAEEIPNENVEAAVKEGEIQGEITPVREEVWQHEPNSPYSPLYVPDKNQKKNNKITIILIVLLILSLIGGMIFAVSKLVEAAMGEISAEAPAWQETINNWKSELEESKKDEEQDSIWDDEEKEDDYWEEYEDDYVDEDGYVPNEDDKYYVTLADSIRDDLSYSVEKHEYTFFDDDDNVDIYVEYVTVEGGSLASEDKINEALEEGAMYYAKEFGSEDATDIMIYVESYVTYMDEDTLSVVVSEEVLWGYDGQVDLYCMNFALTTGALLYNTNLIDASEELAEDFRDMSDYQNGYIEYLDEISDDEIQEYFSDEDTLILFYTPVGLEVGFNYPNGWVTATLKDYKQYLSKL